MQKVTRNNFCELALIKARSVDHTISQPEKDPKMVKEEALTDELLISINEKIDIEVKIWVGDVYLAKFPKRIGSELEGKHFVVAVMNSGSDNPNVVVVPLTSLKEKRRNPAHSVYLGHIKGIDNGKESVALLNQVTCIDKKRLLNVGDMKYVLHELKAKTVNEGDDICQIGKIHYRLSDKQLNELLTKARLYFQRNSQNDGTKKLVDF